MESEIKKYINHTRLPVNQQNYRRWFLYFIRSGHIALIHYSAYVNASGQKQTF